MNSSEQKEFESVTPAQAEVLETVSIIRHNLELQSLNLEENSAAKEGYEEAIILLTENKNSYDQISSSIKNHVSQAIAVLAINYLNGECSRETFLALIPNE
ncbi:hypothetical protein ACFP1I_18080 [Dyadobacter subterraneus]|uniref:Uncharacterized protein n=1 Tax=Dyadobacter subterraneus TaxID=2773304 RepID=A0ABR9WGV9_9BACT|nr:hypothetical protein [Dyadobacter subterraneus]MBE9464735.1 hypothetical protein [Dyadobacter subterraneus]